MENVLDQELSRYSIAAYTETMRIVGELRSPGRRRLLDILNSDSGYFIEISDPEISFLDPRRSGQIRRSSAVINKENITFVLPLQEAAESSPDMRISKRRLPAIVYTRAYLIRGNLHTIELLALQDYLDQRSELYVAMTDASAIHTALPHSKPVSQKVLLLNKSKVIAVHQP